MPTKFNERAIAGLYHANPIGRAVLTVISEMPRQNETLVEALGKRLPKISRRDIVTILKRLQEFGAGEFIEGRRGHPSRFHWSVDSVNVSTLDVAFPSAASAEPVGFTPAATVGHSMLITHKYQLRSDLQVMLQLPADITDAEAKRLSMFISSLPFSA